MKTRSGENVPLRELLDEAVERARKIIEQKNPELSEAEKNEIAQIIGIGAVKYADLSQYRMTDYVFPGTECFRSRATPRLICRMPTSGFARFSARRAGHLFRLTNSNLSRTGGDRARQKPDPVCRDRARRC